MLEPDPDRRPSLAAVRAVLKRATTHESAVRPAGAAASMDSLTASLVGAKPVLPAPAARTPATKLGVPPPPERASARHGIQSARMQARKNRPVWLVLLLIVVLGVAAAALVFVLAS